MLRNVNEMSEFFGFADFAFFALASAGQFVIKCNPDNPVNPV